VEELEPLHGVRLQGNGGVVVIGRLLPLEDTHQAAIHFPALEHTKKHAFNFGINSNFNV
jgi:hypothetical protein